MDSISAAPSGIAKAIMAHGVEKEAAARASLRFVRDGAMVELGSGSTATDFVRLPGQRVRTGPKIRGKTGELATTLGIPLTSFDQVQEIDVTIDGAMNLIRSCL